MAQDSSKITTDLVPDSPVKLDANYRIDIHDRRYIDNQILGVEQHLTDNVLSGYSATWGTLDSASEAVVAGDCLVVKADNVTKATGSDLLNAGVVLGVACISANPNARVRYIIGGSIPPTISGLSTGLSEAVICNSSTGRLERTASVGPSDFQVGFSSTTGSVTMTHGAGSGGGGGGGSSTTSFVIDGASGSVSAGQWVVQTDSASDPPTCALITSANFNKGVIGMALQAGVAGNTILVATTGQVAKSSVTGLGAGTAGYIVVNTTTGLSNRKAVPAFQDIIGGTSDAHGNVTVSVIQSRLGQSFEDPRDYGSVPGDDTTDGTSPTLAAFTAAQTNTVNPTYPNIKPFRFAPGATQISKPLRVTKSHSVIEGHGEGLSTVRPNFQGPWCVAGPDLTDLPPVLANGPFGGCALNLDQGRDYCIDLRMSGCGELAGLSAVTVEMWVYLTSAITGGSKAVLFASAGKEKELPNVFDTALLLMVQSDFVNTELAATFKIGQTVFTARTGDSLSTGTWTHVAVTWDGSNIRLFVGGVLKTTQSTTASEPNGLLLQRPWEGVYLGATRGIVGEYTYLSPLNGVRIGPTRGSSTAVYTAGFSPPVAAFPVGSATDLWVINWDEGLAGAGNANVVASDVYKGRCQAGVGGAGRPVWFPIVGAWPDVNHLLTGFVVRDLTVYGDNGATPGGIFVQQIVQWKTVRYNTQLTWFHFRSRNNAFESHFYDGSHSGTFFYPGVINATTSGDIFSGYNVANCSYCFVLSGGQELLNTTVGSWEKDCAGISCVAATINMENVFWDAEQQPYPSRGALFASGCKVAAKGLQLSGGGLIDNPSITLDNTDADLEFKTQSDSYTSAIVDILSAPTNQVKVKGLDYGQRVPVITSSTNADIGKCIVECGTAGDAVGMSLRNKATLEQYHGDAATTNGTAAFIADCAVTIEPHTSATIDCVIDATRDNDTDCATFKISEKWQRGRLGTNPSKIYSVSTPINIGSASGGTAPPTGWAAALVLNSGVVKPQVTGAAASNITWSGNIVVTKGRVLAPSWTAIELAPDAWFRGDVGSVASWTDQSGNGHDAPAGTTAPTATTLGGQVAFDFAGGAWFENTLTNLLTSGGACTVLAVAQAADATGGTLFAVRRDTAPLCFQIFTSGSTYVGGFAAGNVTLLSSAGTYTQPKESKYDAQTLFASEWSLYPIGGTGSRGVRFDLRGESRYTSGSAGIESGTTGFSIGKRIDAGGQPWNGKIAELVILNRSITAAERFQWRAYVTSRYGAGL